MIDWLLGSSLWAWRSGEFAFARGWPQWLFWVLLAAALCAVVASMVWQRRRAPLGQLGWWRTLVLGALQLAFFAIVLLALWRPVINVERIRDRENVVAVMVDDSGSMNTSDEPGEPLRRQLGTAALEDGVISRIAASSEVRLFGFSDRATSIEAFKELAGGAPQTRIGDSLQSVLQMASSVPLAAVVLVSDGGETGETLGEADLARLAATGVPVHTVGVGPEQLDNDLELEQIEIPQTATAGEMLRAQVSVRHQKQLATRVRIYDGAELIGAQDLTLEP